MVRLHEIIKIVADLNQRGEIELARAVAGHYMDRLDSPELRFNHLALTAKLGETDQVMNLLENYLDQDRWFSTWFLQRVPELETLEDLPRYQKILQATTEKEAVYRQDPMAKPVVQVPPYDQPVYPLLVAIHGNGFSPQHSASHWSVAAQAGWLVFHPAAERLVGYGRHWWDSHEENQEIITRQAAEHLDGYPIDPGRVILGGFSKGGETAMVLALRGWRAARGFITIGAGGYFHIRPERWQPLLESPPPGLRGVAMYSPYDLERSEGETGTLEMLRSVGIEIRLEKYPGEGHVFPKDFASRFREAAAFVLGSPIKSRFMKE